MKCSDLNEAHAHLDQKLKYIGRIVGTVSHNFLGILHIPIIELSHKVDGSWSLELISFG
jgi:hypothetical protein